VLPINQNVLIHLRESTSYIERLSELQREAGNPLTEQIVAVIERAIAEGEVVDGDKLPPTRELAELAGVNHLTAARAYRRLANRGAVVSKVGAGTFVRGAAAIAQEPPLPGRPSTSWQRYALRPDDGDFVDTVLADLFESSARPDGEVIPLMSGYPSERLFPAEQLAELAAAAIAARGPAAWQYAQPNGDPELRAVLAAHAADEGIEADPDQIVVASGARQALLLVARAIAGPGDLVACESPSFAGVVSALRGSGARVLPVPSDADGLDVEVLEQLLRRHEIRMLALQPRLQNPTGRDLSPERRERLIELARRNGFFLVEDAIYAPLRFGGPDPGPLLPHAPEHTIQVDSLSKTVSPGLRAGWVIASGPVLERIAREKQNDDMTGPTLPQLIAARLLGDRDAFRAQIETAIEYYRERCDALLEAIDRELEPFGAPVVRPFGGGHVWVQLHDALDERRLYAEAVRNGVNFMPGSAATVERPEGTFMRLSFSYLEPDQIREGVRRLARSVRAMRRTESTAPRRALPLA
jgi:DNA-binding transcriptional MocR family regulator